MPLASAVNLMWSSSDLVGVERGRFHFFFCFVGARRVCVLLVVVLAADWGQFWDTAPSFEGRREIWDALRAACEATDHEFAKAVLESARIKLPTGAVHGDGKHVEEKKE
jgi:hypothetical protein